MTGRRRTFSPKTKTVTAVLTTVAAAGIAIPVIMSAQGEPATPANAGTAHTPLSSVQKLHPDAACYEVRVPVSVKTIGNAHIYGELCRPRHQSTTSKTVQLLVPGSTYNHSYYDMPVANGRYSYVSAALDAGFSTFNIDRLATGRSTLPPSSRYTLDTGTDTLHQVITQLRDGQIKDRTFDKVVWVGHSLGSSMAWAQAAKYTHDVDAFVLTSMSHVVRKEEPSDNGPGQDIQFEIKAKDDPKFHGTINDPGYLTTNAGMRQFFYDTAHTDPAVIKADERLKDVSTAADSDTTPLPPAKSPSRAIKVPTLLVTGDKDQYCTAGTCTSKTMLASERPYYSDQAGLTSIVVPNSGHNVQLHKNALETNTQILNWIKTTS
ncbi:alpha/beta hydrolase [Streptomyces lancefieldiae]|uniref:Alpha/beta hydrolase n=1 Tax=Streptomyces lancefieldiae TaxID=3075520 RepID=A0ABU3AQ34_9ACTN|nr:alpha/beta hydrolase [Streptomyces sp. DSM 40712]MDT0612276.1 alpha/beta hydrolase [Streptomyces sp. DSM 40712]